MIIIRLRRIVSISKIFKIFFIRFFKRGFPALPVIAIILAEVISLLYFAKLFKKNLSF